jgi:hypothetical protein
MDSFAAGTQLGRSTRRDRPFEQRHAGDFFQSNRHEPGVEERPGRPAFSAVSYRPDQMVIDVAAAIRSQANTAKLLADNPVLMRLRELEVLEKIAAGGKLNIVLGEKNPGE